MKIAIIGTGNVGGTLARKWGKRGHSIYLGVRDTKAQHVQKLIQNIGARASAHSPKEAVSKADVVVLATPWAATEEVVKSLSADLKGKCLIDCTNPLKKDLSGLEVGHTTSGGELVQSWAPQAQVFKAFNTTGFNNMEDPVIEDRKTIMFYCGDDRVKRDWVRELVVDVGFEALDVGPLSSARLLEPWALLWIQSAYKHGLGREFGFSVVRRKS